MTSDEKGPTQSPMDGELAACARALSTRFDLAAVILFGSGGRGRLRPSSDLDLAVLPRCEIDPLAISAAIVDLEARFKRPVDLVDLSRVSPILGHQVLAHGQVLHAADRSLLGAFIARTLSEYEDLKVTRAPVEARILKRARDGR